MLEQLIEIANLLGSAGIILVLVRKPIVSIKGCTFNFFNRRK